MPLFHTRQEIADLRSAFRHAALPDSLAALADIDFASLERLYRWAPVIRTPLR